MSALLVAGCHSGSSTTNAQREPGSAARACDVELAALKRFYDTAAADLEASPRHAGFELARSVAGVQALVAIDGKPADATKLDLLLIGTKAPVLVTVDGELRPIADGSRDLDGIPPAGTSRGLVIAIATDAKVSAVARALADLAKPEDRYQQIAVAYHIDGAFAGRKPPVMTGFAPDRVDIPTIGNTISRDAADHCPAIAKELAAPSSTTFGPGLLRAISAKLPQCDCAVDPAPLEALPWLLRWELVTLVPLAATAPALESQGDATWADLVRAHGGKPIEMALPERKPLPPPPPPPHHRAH